MAEDDEDTAPRLYLGGLPENQKEPTSVLGSTLSELDRHASNFRSALTLFDVVTAELQKGMVPWSPQGGWRTVAARDGAMTIYHFGQSMNNIRDCLHLCPAVVPLVDRDAQQALINRFRSKFPRFEQLRHAIAHAGDFTTPKKVKEHSFTGTHQGGNVQLVDVKQMMIRDVIDGRRIHYSFSGTLLDYELSEETLGHLSAIKRDFFSLYRAAATALLAMARSVR